MKSKKTKQFDELYALLPEKVKQQAREAFHRFQNDPYDPTLEFKHIKRHNDLLRSARFAGKYRALALVDNDTVTWFWIGKKAGCLHVLDRLRS